MIAHHPCRRCRTDSSTKEDSEHPHIVIVIDTHRKIHRKIHRKQVTEKLHIDRVNPLGIVNADEYNEEAGREGYEVQDADKEKVLQSQWGTDDVDYDVGSTVLLVL